MPTWRPLGVLSGASKFNYQRSSSMANYGTVITGTGTSSGQFGVGGTDLAIPYKRWDGTVGYVLGDTFNNNGVGGAGWRSPVMLYGPGGSIANGITFNGAYGGSYATQMLNYAHNANNGLGFEGTRIPTDVMSASNNNYLAYASVKDVHAGTVNCGRICYWDNSTNPVMHDGLVTFDDINFTNIVFCGSEGGKHYMMSKPWGRNNSDGPILFRASDIGNKSTYEYWNFAGGNWHWGPEYPTKIFPGMGSIGELSVRKVGSKWVMSYFDVVGYCISTRTATSLDGVWSAPKQHVWGVAPGWTGKPSFPQLYGGFIHPESTLTNLKLIVSQWNTTTNWPYWAMQFDGLVA